MVSNSIRLEINEQLLLKINKCKKGKKEKEMQRDSTTTTNLNRETNDVYFSEQLEIDDLYTKSSSSF